MTARLTLDELAALMKSAAGLTVDPAEMAEHPDATFAEFGLDSLGLLGIVGELENRYGRPLPPDTERARTPRDFLGLVNTGTDAAFSTDTTDTTDLTDIAFGIDASLSTDTVSTAGA